MSRAKAPPRVKGPYSERGGTRFRIRIYDMVGHRDLYFATRAEALAGMRQAARELPTASEGRWLGAILDEYIKDKVQRGLCNSRSGQEDLGRLRFWLIDYLEEDIGKVTPKRAAALYERLVGTPTRKTGQPPTAATHRCYLHRAQTLFRWAVRKGYVRENPFESVQPVGRPNRGKKQLRFEEAERFIAAGFRMFDERGDALALAAVTALLLGCRAGEVLHVRVRDLDCGGTRLWIAASDSGYHGKTRNAARNPEVPEVLRPRLLERAANRPPDAYLFGVGSTGKPRARQALHVAVHRVCRAASVPLVCPHSLRGLWATAGVRSGALSHAVAAALGHGSFAVTAKHYVQPGTLDGARTERLVKMLELDTPKQPSDPATLQAEQLLSSLSPETLAKLLELATRASAPKPPLM